ncbi:MAG: hypothetical protein JSV89_02035, partial [Spirochaetaceae bacterium]
RDDYWHTQNLSLEDALVRIERAPDADAIAKRFDFEAAYQKFVEELIDYQRMCGEMLFMPAQWDNIPRILFSDLLGYEAFLTLIGLYPDRVAKLIEASAAEAYLRNTVLAKAIEEGLYPHAVLFGEDICNQRGPMISPDFLKRYYLPQLAHSLEPLLKVGCRPVWHSDGNILPMVDMLIDCGIQGFQGFQTECGVRLESLVGKRTSEGQKLLIFGPLSVATELTRLPPEQIKLRVRRAIEICIENADLVIFTSNTINPDVPLENIYAMYEALCD